MQTAYWAAVPELPLLDKTCGQVLREAAAIRPTHTALVGVVPESGTRRRWTYAEMLTEAEAIARAMRGQLPAGSHVAVWAANRPEWIFTQFGLALAGMVMVTVNPALRPAELAYVLRQSRARAVIHDDLYRGQLMREGLARASEIDVLQLDLTMTFDELAALARRYDPDQNLPRVNSASAAMIQYTSGTSGKPKGVVLSHYSVTNNARIMALLKEQNPSTINLHVAPLFHTGGCVGGVLATVQSLGTMVLPPSFDPGLMLDLIEREKVTYTFSVPTMLVALLREQQSHPRDVSSLKTIFTGGTTVPEEIVRRVEESFDARVIIGYGMTETSPAITHTRPNDTPADKSSTIGRPIPQVEVKIIDPDTGAAQPVDVPGELCTRGFHVMLGYHDMPVETSKCIDVDGWLHTGDLCSMDSRGYCRVHGRLKDMIIRGGENIYPSEIEDALYAHPAVAEVAVIGVPSDYWGEEVAAVFVCCSGHSVNGKALQEFLHDQLAAYKVPKYWYSVAELPMTASGKVQKFRLSEMLRDGELGFSLS